MTAIILVVYCILVNATRTVVIRILAVVLIILILVLVDGRNDVSMHVWMKNGLGR